MSKAKITLIGMDNYDHSKLWEKFKKICNIFHFTVYVDVGSKQVYIRV